MTAYDKYTRRVDDELEKLIPGADIGDNTVSDAMRYSISAGGKRIRPLLTMEFCRLCGEEAEKAVKYACAIEMIHTYSLIHDDLPCMDDDDMRRGKPSCHVQFGEEYALLAGDALLTLAFSVVSGADLPPERNCEAVKVLSECAGYRGMIGGQTLDLKGEGQNSDADYLKKTDILKTGKLIEAASVLGCIAAGAEEKYIKAAVRYSHSMGMAFQITDDILDVISTDEQLGKPVGSDAENQKNTYVTLMGLEKAKKEAQQYTSDAVKALDVFGEESDTLKKFTLSLLSRNK